MCSKLGSVFQLVVCYTCVERISWCKNGLLSPRVAQSRQCVSRSQIFLSLPGLMSRNVWTGWTFLKSSAHLFKRRKCLLWNFTTREIDKDSLRQGRVIQHQHTCRKTSFTFLALPHLILSSRWDECNHVFVCFSSLVNVDACCVYVFVCARLLHLSPLCTLDVWLPSPEATEAFHQFSYFLC